MKTTASGGSVLRGHQQTRADAFKERFAAEGVSWVHPHNAGDGNAGTDFSVRIQNPSTYPQVHGLVEEINDWKGIAAPVAIDGIEVSFDATPKEINQAAVEDMTCRLMIELLPPIIYSNARLVGADTAALFLLSSRKCRISADMTMYVGDWSKENSLPADGIAFRVYMKTRDDRQALPSSEHRARAEAIIAGSALRDYGLSSLSSLKEFKFERLANLFRFARAVPGRIEQYYATHDDLGHLYYKQRGVDETAPACIINHLARKDSRGRPLSKSHLLKIEPDLTDIARDQLRKLSVRFKGKPRMPSTLRTFIQADPVMH
jgi:hypothetical protein